MMAELSIDFPEDFLSGLLDAEIGEIAEDVLTEAAPILEESTKRELSKVIEHDGESETVESIKVGKPKKTKTDAYMIKIGPTGYSSTKVYKNKKSGRTYKVSNSQKMAWKEYGVPGRQPAKPFLTKACNNVKNDVTNKMQEVYNRKVEQNES